MYVKAGTMVVFMFPYAAGSQTIHVVWDRDIPIPYGTELRSEERRVGKEC